MNYEQEFELFKASVESDRILQDIQAIMGNQIFEATKTLSTGLDLVKKLTDIAVSTKNIELKETVLELKNQLLTAKAALLEVKEENLDLREEVNELKRQLEKVAEPGLRKMVVRDGVYYTADGGDGPFCTLCYDADKIEIRLTPLGPLLDCPKCKNRLMA